MELPIPLKEKLEQEIEKIELKKLKQSAQDISEKYRDKSLNKMSTRLITSKEDAVAYAVSRMPATYGAVYSALEHSLEMMPNERITSLLDVGAGTGTATWAVNELLDVESNICVENEDYMLNLGKILMKNVIDNVQWIKKNIITDNIEQKADLVISSYVLNEIKTENRNQILEKLWNSARKLLLIIEPGTPEGYNQIKEIRDYFIKKGANIVAPCAHEKECKISKDDWCAFSCRVSRTKVHKMLKEGDAPYEDEKFSYIAISKTKTEKVNRILRHPKIENGRITLKLCTTEGNIEEKTITKKEKERFKTAKKLNNGDILK
mgnify:CR=1 FL=1